MICDVELDHHLVEFCSFLGDSLDLTFFAILGIRPVQVGILFFGNEVLNLGWAKREQWRNVLLFILLDCTAHQLLDLLLMLLSLLLVEILELTEERG
jgi:hypothetical protein